MSSFGRKNTSLPEYLANVEKTVKAKAKAFGLDFWDIVFEILDSDDLNEVAAFGGFPTRYPHWKFGMSYNELNKGYVYGLSKIYELVINNDPCYAYLMRQNSTTIQKLVMAHVCGHADFFKNNMWFAHTSRKMVDKTANNAMKIRKIADKYGHDKIEDFIDTCMSIENLIDIYSPYLQRKPAKKEEIDETSVREEVTGRKLKTNRSYMDKYINPPEFLEAQKQIVEQKIEKQVRTPLEPERDVLGFLIEHAPLKPWQVTILEIIREEAYYFAPQGLTKTINEGFAVYAHSNLLTRCGVLDDTEIIEYARVHAGTLGSNNGMNPYKIGVELLLDIEERWNKGRFGKEYEQCDSYKEKDKWDKKLGLGKQKVFEVRKTHNDITFIDEFLTEDFCKEKKLFVYDYDKSEKQYVISSRDFRAIKDRYLKMIVNFGQPVIYVENSNHKNRGELYLRHQHDGMDLKSQAALDTLTSLQKIWGRPVHIETVMGGKKVILSADGDKHFQELID